MRILILLILSYQALLYSSDPNPHDLPMTTIKKWQDVSPFTGKIIAYRATGAYYTPNEYDYWISKELNLRLGYIGGLFSWTSPFNGTKQIAGYNMHTTVTNQSTVEYTHARIIEPKLQEDIQLRLATKDELTKLERLMTSETVFFGYMSPTTQANLQDAIASQLRWNNSLRVAWIKLIVKK